MGDDLKDVFKAIYALAMIGVVAIGYVGCRVGVCIGQYIYKTVKDCCERINAEHHLVLHNVAQNQHHDEVELNGNVVDNNEVIA